MSTVIDINLPPEGREQGTKRKHKAAESGKENVMETTSRSKPTKRAKMKDESEQVSKVRPVSSEIFQGIQKDK